MSNEIIFEFFIVIAFFPILVVALPSALGGLAKRMLVNDWGMKSQLRLGSLGTFLHELGHLVTAKLFRHRIDDYKLIQFRHVEESRTLGYVVHTWDGKSFYQKFGNFFIGIAPFYVCSGFLFLMHRILIGTKYSFEITMSDFNPLHLIGLLFNNVSSNLAMSWQDNIGHPLMFLIFGLLALSISFTGFSISAADWYTTFKGLKYYILILFILFIIGRFTVSFLFINQSWAWIAFMTFLAVSSCLYIIFGIVVAYLLRKIINFL